MPRTRPSRSRRSRPVRATPWSCGAYDDPLASHHLLFRDLFIRDIGGSGNQDGLKLSGVRDFIVLDCEITRCGGGVSGSGIDHVGCHRGLIAGCFLHDLSGNAVQCKGGSSDIEIRGCHLRDAGQRGVNMGGSTGTQFFRPPLSPTEPNVEASDIRVLGNLIEGGVTAVAFVGCVDSVAAGNTIVDPDNWLFRILQRAEHRPRLVHLHPQPLVRPRRPRSVAAAAARPRDGGARGPRPAAGEPRGGRLPDRRGEPGRDERARAGAARPRSRRHVLLRPAQPRGVGGAASRRREP
ncbi:MAG: right-handed parallel beta-helix repeat-containing protein [Planctomycetota bacterium]